MSRVRSVNVGRPRDAEWATIGRTSVLKESVSGPVAVHELGLAGDEVSNRRHHGGRDKAVYAFAREDLDRWAELLGTEVPDGTFAENLTTEGIDVNAAELGERWRVGGPEGPVLEVASFRTPCAVFQAWMGRLGLRPPGLGAPLRRGRPPRALPARRRTRHPAGRRRHRGGLPRRRYDGQPGVPRGVRPWVTALDGG